MAAQNPPYTLQAGSHSAELFRRASNTHLLAAGVKAQADLLVAANGTPNMTVNVAAGTAWILGTETTNQGPYYAFNDASVSLAIAAADPTNPRRDLIVAKVQDAAYSGATNTWSLAVVTGTPAGSPVDPAIPANAIVLARVAVAALATSIVAGNITDLRAVAVWRWGSVQVRPAVGGTSLDLSDNTNSSLRISHPSSGVVRFDCDAGNVFRWSAALVTTMSLSGAGLLSVTGGTDITGSPTGYAGGELRFPLTAAAAVGGISTLWTGACQMDFDHRGTGNTGIWSWNNGTNAGTNVMKLDAVGNIAALGPNHTFGRGIFGAGSAFVQLGDDATGAYIQAGHGTVANMPLQIRMKGVSQVQIQTATANNLLTINNLGHITTGNGASGAPAMTSGYGAGWTITVSGTDTAGLITLTDVSAGSVSITPASVMATLTFANARATVPRVVIFPNGVTSRTTLPYLTSVATTGFSIVADATVPVTNGTSVVFSYIALQ